MLSKACDAEFFWKRELAVLVQFLKGEKLVPEKQLLEKSRPLGLARKAGQSYPRRGERQVQRALELADSAAATVALPQKRG